MARETIAVMPSMAQSVSSRPTQEAEANEEDEGDDEDEEEEDRPFWAVADAVE